MAPDPTNVSGDSPSLRLTDDPSSPAAARRFVSTLITDVDPDRAYEVLLAVSELVTNSVRHGQAPVTVRVDRDPDELTVSVHDHGPTLPTERLVSSPSAAPGGRGLLIIAALAARWGVDVDADGSGKAVWVTFSTAVLPAAS